MIDVNGVGFADLRQIPVRQEARNIRLPERIYLEVIREFLLLTLLNTPEKDTRRGWKPDIIKFLEGKGRGSQ